MPHSSSNLLESPQKSVFENYDEAVIFQLLSENGKYNDLKAFLQKLSFHRILNMHNSTGYTPLHLACSNGNFRYTEIIIKDLR